MAQSDSIKMDMWFKLALTQPTNAQMYLDSISLLGSKNKLATDLHHYHEAKYLIQKGEIDRALVAINSNLKELTKNKLNPVKQAKYENLLGAIFSLKTEYPKAIRHYKKAIQLYEEAHEHLQAAYIQNNIANLFLSIADYESALKHIREAHRIAKEKKDTLYFPGILAVYAICEVKTNNFQQGKQLAEQALKLSTKTQNVLGIIYSNYALGDIASEEKNWIKALDFYQQTLNLAQLTRQNRIASFTKIALAQTYNELSKFDLSLGYSTEALSESHIQKNKNIQYSIYKNLANSYEGLNQHKKANESLKKAHELFRENASEENKKIINEILIQYETSKKEKEILKNRLKIAEQNTQISYYFIGFIGLLFVLFAGIIFFIRQRKLQKIKEIQAKITQEKALLEAINNGEIQERKRISEELHDGLASEIAGLKLQLEQIQLDEKSTWLERLKNLHESTRRIAHNLMPLILQNRNLDQALKQFCIENQNAKTTILCWTSISGEISSSLEQITYRIAQELIVNALKHAASTEIQVQCSTYENKILLSVEDNGKGFVESTSNGQGIKSLQHRIEQIGGKIHLESSPENGTFVGVEIPFA